MIKTIIVSALVVVALIFGLSWYLQPDDLSHCGKVPGSGLNCQPVDAIVAVSGGDTVARTDSAINLYKNGWSKKLIFSGAAQDKTGPSNAAAMKTLAEQAGVPDSNIYIDEASNSTQENAQNAQMLFSGHDIKSIILVTSGYHQRRAGLEFKKQTNGVAVLNHPVLTDKDWSFWWWTTPRGWWLASSESVKIAIFYATGK